MIDLSQKRLNRTIITLAWPAILENLMHTSVFIVDSIFIGSLGTLAFAAVGQSSMILFTVVFVFYGLGVATGAVVARNLGKGDRKTACEAAGQGILMGTTIGLIVAALGLVLGKDIMVLLGTEPLVVERAQEYMPIIFGFSFLRLFIYTASGILRAAGDTRTPMWITGIMNIYNIIADWVLIFGIGPFPELGIMGAAIATGTAYIVGSSLLLFKIFHRKSKFRLQVSHIQKFRSDHIKTIVRISLPNVGEQAVMQCAYFLFIGIVTSLGTTALTAHFMTIRLEMLSFMPVFGLSIAVSTIVGQSLGAERPDIAEMAVKKAVLIGLSAMGLLGIIFVVFAGPLVSIFNPDPEVYSLAVLCIRIAALELPTSAMLMMYTGAMRGAGDTFSPMLISLFGAIFLRIGMMYFIVIDQGWGLPGIWYGTALDWGIRLLIAYFLFQRGRWKKVFI
tara:strand:+ start:40990 stop:42333 length:1344 start_codon:yes stop_codon:yes gene_type:complete